MLCEKSYSENTQLGISESSGFPNLIVDGLDIRLNKKYNPKDKRSGSAPNNKDSHRYFR